MAKCSLEVIKKNADELATKINASGTLLPTYGYSLDEAHPHIEVDDKGLMHYVTVERGQEQSRETTDELNTLLYWIFKDVTFAMACNYELKNRIEDKDCRRIMFEKQEELLGMLSDIWKQKQKEEHRSTLEKHPFDDLAGRRASYCRDLRQQGYAENEITQLAYEKYPTN